MSDPWVTMMIGGLIVRQRSLRMINGVEGGMAKKVHEFANDPEGWRGRLRLAAEWTQKVLNTSLARDERIESLGMQIGANFEYHPESGPRFLGLQLKDVPEPEDLAPAIMWARPFVLTTESIYWKEVVGSLRGLAEESPARVEVEQVAHIWSRQPIKRVFYHKTTESGENILPEGGVDGGYVAERLLYSQFVHADDASNILDHVDDHAQMWNLAGMVADWIATLSYQERVIQMVAPEVVPELTVWAGNQMTIFERLGAKVVASPADEASGAG